MKKFFTKEKIVFISVITCIVLALLISYFLNFDIINESLEISFKGNVNLIFKGLGNTVFITIVSFICGLILGAIVCLIEKIKSENVFVLILKQLTKIYVSIFRGTPMIVQLLIIYFVIFASYKGDPMYIAMLSFGLNSGAYVSEILRGGINSISKGQMEAGRSLGLSYFQVMKKIIFPQAIRNSLPSLGNELITLFKETSVVGFVGAFDLTLAFQKIAGGSYDYATAYIVMGLTYYVLILVITQLLKALERGMMKNA